MSLNLLGFLLVVHNKKHDTIHLVLCEREEQVALVKQALRRRRNLKLLMDIGRGAWPNLMQNAIKEYPSCTLASVHVWDDFLHEIKWI